MKKAFCAAVTLLAVVPTRSEQWLNQSCNTMRTAKQIFTTILRNKDTSLVDYRKATDHVASILAYEAMGHIEMQATQIQTQLAPFQGTKLTRSVMIIPVLRSGLTLLPAFLRAFQNARVGFVGLQRDEETAKASWYYKKVPQPKQGEYIIIVEPMLATGGTGLEVLRELTKLGVAQNHIIFASVVCAPEGLEVIKSEFPDVTIITVDVDKELNDKKFIVPGLGDFGDRYFDTE